MLSLSISLVCFTPVCAQLLHATISISDTTSANLTPISPLIFGGFIEYIDDVVNGSHSLAAQELTNRGFDMIDNEGYGLSRHWKSWNSSKDGEGNYYLKEGGYNRNGVYFQKLENLKIGKFGIAQEVQLPSTVGTNCYVYCRSDDYKGELFAALISLDGKETYASVSLGKCTQKWEKKSVVFSKLNGIFQAQLVFYIDSIGTIELDEASLLAQDHFHQIRREHLDLYREWKPSIIRFFGGCFSDQPVGRWERSIGDLDKRPSPNFDWLGIYQRIEFGVDEYMAFCESVRAMPQLTVGFGNGSPEDAADWVEYCNGDTLTKNGALRAKNGHPAPYNVKFWEIGNEQYGDWEIGHTTAVKYANRYIDYYRAMKKVDSSISIMINGNMWGVEWNDTIIKIAHDYIDMFSIHYGMGYELTSDYPSDSVYKILMFNPFFFNKWLDYLENSLIESGLPNTTKLAITEWIQLYGASAKPHNRNAASLQSGLWNAQIFNVIINHASSINLVNKTVYNSVIQSGVNSQNGERFIFGDPSYHVIKLFNNFIRKNKISFKIDSPVYDFNSWKNAPWLNATVTYSDDTVVCSLINTHPTDSMEVSIKFPFSISNREFSISQIYSENYTDASTPDFPNKIVPTKTSKRLFNNSVKLPPHSFSLISLPIGKTPDIKANPVFSEYHLDILPNPTANQMIINLDIPRTGTISIEIYNSIGERQLALPTQIYSKGKFSIPINLPQLSDGTYFCKITTDTGVISTQFVVVQ
ncbi:MAG: T9SS type A sorting domain-containing protein [Bacteroidetes bacterium]|nr:T9SS type A sorting domain-containing protein [Bacteroidota bacterium]